jgi:hypothetical protein
MRSPSSVPSTTPKRAGEHDAKAFSKQSYPAAIASQQCALSLVPSRPQLSKSSPVLSAKASIVALVMPAALPGAGH